MAASKELREDCERLRSRPVRLTPEQTLDFLTDCSSLFPIQPRKAPKSYPKALL